MIHMIIKYLCLIYLLFALCSSVEIPNPKKFIDKSVHEYESEIDFGEGEFRAMARYNVTIHDIIGKAVNYGFVKKIFWLLRRLDHFLGDGLIVQVTFPDKRDSIYQWTVPVLIESYHFVTMLAVAEHPSYGPGEQLFVFHSDVQDVAASHLKIGYFPDEYGNETEEDYVRYTKEALNCNKKGFVSVWLLGHIPYYVHSFFLLRKLGNSYLHLKIKNTEYNRRDLVNGVPILKDVDRFEIEVDGIFGPYPDLDLEHGLLHEIILVVVHQDPTTREDSYVIGPSLPIRITKNDSKTTFGSCNIEPFPIGIDNYSNPRLPTTDLIPVDRYFTSPWMVPDPYVSPKNSFMNVLVNVSCPPSRFKCHHVEVHFLRNCAGEPLYSTKLPAAHDSTDPSEFLVSFPGNISIPMGEYCWRIEKPSYFFRKISYSTPIAVLGGPIEGMNSDSVWTPIGRNGFYITLPLNGANIKVSKFVLKLYNSGGYAEFDHLKNIEPLICTAEYEFAVPEIMTPGTKVYFDVLFGDVFNSILFWKKFYMFRLFIGEAYEDTLNDQLVSIYPFGQSPYFTLADSKLPESFSPPLIFEQRSRNKSMPLKANYVNPVSPFENLESPFILAIYDNYQFANFHLAVTSIISP